MSRSSRDSRRRRGRLGACLAALALACAAAPAVAIAPDLTNQQRVDASVVYLRATQNADGGFPQQPGGSSDVGSSQWVALALAVAGVNPLDQVGDGGADLYSYLTTRSTELIDTPSIALAVLVARAAGADPRAFAGRDLVQELIDRQLDGSDPATAGGVAQLAGGTTSDPASTALTALALARLLQPVPHATADAAAVWLTRAQHPDGGWAEEMGGPPTPTMTGLVLQALAANARLDQQRRADAVAWLQRQQNDDAGFPEQTGGATRPLSTAWAAMGLWAAGTDPRRLARGTSDPLARLAALRAEDGHIADPVSTEDDAPVLVTAATLPAFAAALLPLDAVPRSRQVRPPPTTTPTTPAPPPPAPPAPAPTTPQPAPAPPARPQIVRPPRTFPPAGVDDDGIRRLGVEPAGRPPPRGDDRRPRARPRRRATTPPAVAPGTSDGNGDGGTIATPGAPDRAGGGGALVATGADATATGGNRDEQSRESQQGGPLRSAARADGGEQISGVVVGGETRRAAGDRAEEQAAAAGLLGSQAGGRTGPSIAIGLAMLIALTAAGGAFVERRSRPVPSAAIQPPAPGAR